MQIKMPGSQYSGESQDFDAFDRARIDRMNAACGKLEGVDCPICKNKGVIYYLRDGCDYSRPCECMGSRKSQIAIKESGLTELLQTKTFDTFSDDTEWQKVIKQKSVRFAEFPNKEWFYIGGQVGCGKTHICTAILNQMLQTGRSARYMLWRDEAQKLKSALNTENYSPMIEKLKKVEVLYIDDFLKVQAGEKPTPGDINIAFEIVNSRYLDSNKITIFSSEHFISGLMQFDGGLCSRIYERCKSYRFEISCDDTKNMRLKQ